jgi:hypothetical protein
LTFFENDAAASQILRARAADTEDRRQADLGVLVVRDVNPAIRAIVFPQTKIANARSALALLVARIRADHANDTFARMILQLRQMRLTDAITFMIFPFFKFTSPGTIRAGQIVRRQFNRHLVARKIRM